MANESYIRAQIASKCKSRCADGVIVELACAQHGVVGRAQLLARGVRPGQIVHRLGYARLHPLYAGVYAVGHPMVSRHGRWMAAVLAGGPGAVLSHRSAAALWGIRAGAGRIEVTVPRSRRSRPGLRVHRVDLPADETTIRDAIPVTTVPRTIFDLAAVADARQVRGAANEAEVLRLSDPLSLADMTERHPNSRGVATIRNLAGDLDMVVTRSELERHFLRCLEQWGLPRPRVNALLEVAGRRFEVDCVWPEDGVIVELDGHASHGTRLRFEADRERDRLLQVAGWRVVRLTWRQLSRDPRRVAEDLRALVSG